MTNVFPQHWQEILDSLPPLPTRKQIASASGGLIAAGTLANLDSQGRGIPERRIIGKRTCSKGGGCTVPDGHGTGGRVMQQTLERQSPAGGPGDVLKTHDSSRILLPCLNPTRQEVCFNCESFRAVRTSSRHVNTFCQLTGEKLRPDTPACPFFPGGGR